MLLAILRKSIIIIGAFATARENSPLEENIASLLGYVEAP